MQFLGASVVDMGSSFPTTDRTVQKMVHGLEIMSWWYFDSRFLRTDFLWRWICSCPSKMNTSIGSESEIPADGDTRKKETIFPLASLWIGKMRIVAAFSKKAFLFPHFIFCSFFIYSNIFQEFGMPGGWRGTSSYNSQIRNSKMKKKTFNCFPQFNWLLSFNPAFGSFWDGEFKWDQGLSFYHSSISVPQPNESKTWFMLLPLPKFLITCSGQG